VVGLFNGMMRLCYLGRALSADAERKIYVVKCKFLKWENKSKSRVLVSCPLFGQRFVWKNSDIMRYGMVTQLSDSMVLVDKVFCLSFPQVLGSD
jgi:hypothetical protein